MLNYIVQKKWKISLFLIILFTGWVLYQSLNQPQSQTHINKPFPMIKISNLDNDRQSTIDDLIQGVRIVHVWASWCGICLDEHQTWVNIKDKWHYPLVGIIYRDDPKKVLNFLASQGSPYNWILNDDQGTLGMALGLMGTPQTYIVDKNGVIKLQYLGAVDEKIFEKEFVPLLEKLSAVNG